MRSASKIMILVAVASWCWIDSASGQITTASNTTAINLPDKGVADLYPSPITISGAKAHLSKITVKFPNLAASGTLGGLDLLLESPSGTKMVLLSDLNNSSVFTALVNVSFSSEALVRMPLMHLSQPYPFLPTNYDSDTDNFPAPGPGVVIQPHPSFQAFVNENPNGIWKLYALDDWLDNGTTFFYSGWSLTIESSDSYVCPKPELPIPEEITDTTTRFSWLPNGPAVKWDAYYGTSPLSTPVVGTVPTIQQLGSPGHTMTDLTPAVNYEMYVRSSCPNGTKSAWNGPTKFRTTFTPCIYAPSILLCRPYALDSSPVFTGFGIDPLMGLDSMSEKRMLRFTAPETGDYWLNEVDFFWHVDDGSACPTSDWKHTNGLLEQLEGGRPYWFLMKENSAWDDIIRVSGCPPLSIQSNPTFQSSGPFSSTSEFHGSAIDFQDSFDLLVTADLNWIPDYNAVPTVSNYRFTAANLYRCTFNNLEPETQYNIWIRRQCPSGDGPACWYQTGTFLTVKYCGDFDELWYENITKSSATVYFKATTDELTVDCRFGLSPTMTPPTYNWQTGAELAGDVISKAFNGLLPDTTYYLFLRPFCLPNGGNNPWQGPFPVRTLNAKWASKSGAISGCGAFFVPPGGDPDELYHYDYLKITPSQPGSHTFRYSGNNSRGGKLLVYDGLFDPTSPVDHLIGQSQIAAGVGNSFSTDLEAVLDTGKSYYCVLTSLLPSANSKSDAPVLLAVAGPTGPPVLSAFMVLGKTAMPYAPIAALSGAVQKGEFDCLSTNGWRHVYSAGALETTRLDDKLLFSFQDFSGYTKQHYPIVGGAPGTAIITSPPADYLHNLDKWVTFNRYWLWPDTTFQPAQPIRVRYYFTGDEVDQLKETVEALGGTPPAGVSDLYAFVVNGFHPDPQSGHAGIPASGSFGNPGFWEYENANFPSSGQWSLGQYKNGFYAEFPVRQLSGGGMGVGIHGGGALGVSDIGFSPWTNVFPNPSSGSLVIQSLSDDCRIMAYRVKDVHGRTLTEKDGLDSVVETFQLDLPTSTFLLLEIESSKGRSRHKIVLVR